MNKRRLGTAQVALAAVLWSFGGVLCKWIPWGSLSLHGLRTVFAALFLMLLRRGWRVKLTKGTCLGALGTMLTSLLYISAAKLTTAANAIVLQYAMPAFVILFCWIFYGQKPGRANVITAACILAGVALCSFEGLSAGNVLGDALGLCAAVTFALVFFCSKLPGANAQDYTYLGHVVGIPFALCALNDPAMTLEPMHWLAIIAMGACLAGGYYFISLGMTNTSPVTAALLANLEPILSPFWVFVFLGEQPGVLTLIGAAIVLTAATVYSIMGARRPAEENS